jgi:predicted Zn-dependent peptidase
MAAFFGAHPLGRSVLGTTGSVGGLARDQMLDYFRQRYSPRNMILAAAGNVNWDELLAQAQDHTAAWQAFDAPRVLANVVPQQAWQVIHKPQATQQYVVQLSAAPAAEDEDRYAARLLGTIVGDDTGSRLFWELVDTGLAETAAWGPHEFQRSGVFMTYLSCAPEEAAGNLARIREVLADVEASGVTAEELELAQNKICAHIVLQAERPTNRLFAVGNAWLQRRQYKTVREAVESYRRVTLADIRMVIEKYPLTRTATVAVGPLTELAAP